MEVIYLLQFLKVKLEKCGYLNEMSKQNLFKYIREYQAIIAKYPRQGKGIEPLCSDVGLEDPGTVYRNNEEKVIEKPTLINVRNCHPVIQS